LSNTTNPFTFQVLLDASDIDQSKLSYYFHSKIETGKNIKIYEQFMSSLAWMETYQANQKKDRFKADEYIAFFVKTYNTKEMVFIGVYKIIGVTESQDGGDCYDFERYDELMAWSGRLFVEDPTTTADIYRKAQSIKNQGGLPILHITKDKKALPFPGFHKFNHSLKELKTMPTTWQEELKRMKGVYLLTCRKHHKLYVGSASGEEGFLQRWVAYADGNAGGNKELENFLKSNSGADFHISILEIASSSDDPDKIIAKENSWKAKLNTRDLAGNGLNCN
jgi:hypothetical protein